MAGQLSVEDYARVLRAIECLGSADDYESLPERALAAVTAAIDVDFASYCELDLNTGNNRYLVRPDPHEQANSPAALARQVRRFGNHPILAHRLVSESLLDSGLEDFISRLRLMGMVGNCCGEAGVTLNLELTVQNSERRMVGISVHRGIREFDEHDAAVLRALRPHLKSALRVAARLAAAPVAERVTGIVSGVPLTPRENQVLYWVAMGKTNDEVGTILGARPMTVKKHLEHIYDKLGVPNRTAAARAFRAQMA